MRKAIWICVFFMMFGVSSVSFARDPGKELAAQNEAQSKMMAKQTAALKAYLTETIVAQRETPSRRFGPQYRATLKQKLASLPIERLQALKKNGGYDGSQPGIVQDLGDSSADLVYTPVTPCRIIDTRQAGGIIAAGTTRDFYVSDPADSCGSGYGCQGGSATGCGIPFGPATAVMINYVAVGPTGSGDLRAWPYAGTMPTASVINYIPNQNVANAVIQPICDISVSTCISDLSVHADSRNVHLVADVVGYFRTFPKEQIKSFVVNDSTGTPDVPDPLPIGTSCTNYMSITVDTPGPGRVLVNSKLTIQLNHVTPTESTVRTYIGTSATDCPDSIVSLVDWPAVQPSGSYFPQDVLGAVFDVSTSGPVTYYLNGKSISGSGHNFWFGSMEATFIPD